MNSIEISPCITLWMGQIEGNLQTLGGCYFNKTISYQEKVMFLNAMRSIQSSCEAITNSLKDAKEVV